MELPLETTMTRKEGGLRASTASSSTDSWISTETEKASGSLFRGPSRSRTPIQLSTDEKEK